MHTFNELSDNPLSLLPVSALDDNYFWLIHNKHYAIVVDPGDAQPLLQLLNILNLEMVAILLTHHHSDHIGGVQVLLRRFNSQVFGPAKENINGVDCPLREGDKVTIPKLGINFSVIDVPGHTSGHIAYIAREKPWLFCGDTLFAGGCGRLFEGTPKQMVNSLNKMSNLPGETLVYCAHEYTIDNLRFALEVEPTNSDLVIRMKNEKTRRMNHQPTLPSNIALENATNPFLRCSQKSIIDNLHAHGRLSKNYGKTDPVAVFSALRKWKNNFK
jgi:hydroxyacylglutathione hydrolase